MLLSFRSLAVAVLVTGWSLCGRCHCADIQNPGISLRLSEHFYTYVLNSVASPLIEQELGKVKIPDVNAHIPYINTDIYLTGLAFDPKSYRLHPQSFLMPNANMSALEARVGVYVSGNGHWRTRTRWWPHISESGSVHFDTNPMWVLVAISMKPGSNGIWNFTLADFSLDCDLELKFTGDGMSGIDVGALRKDINNIANQAASKELTTVIGTVLDNLTPMLEKFLPYISYKNCTRFSIPGCQDFALNLSLSNSVVWKQNCSSAIQLNGYLLYKDHAFLPSPASPFPPPQGCGDHSASLLLSGGTFSSLVAAILASGLVHGNFPTNKLASDAHYDQYLPGLKKYGNLSVYANMTLLNISMFITNKEMRVQFGASFELLVDTTPKALLRDKVFKEAVAMVVTCTVGMTAWINNITTPVGIMPLLYLNFSTARIDGVSLHNSSIGYVAVDKVHELMQQLMTSGFNSADSFMAKGILIIPNHVKGIALKQPQLVIGEGYLRLAIDVGEYNATAAPSPADDNEYSRYQNLAMEKAASRIDPHTMPNNIAGAIENVVDAFLEMGVIMARQVKESLLMFAQGPPDLE